MANGDLRSTKKVEPTAIQSKMYNNWLAHLTEYPPYESAKFERETTGSQSNNTTILNPMVVLRSSFQDAQKKNYTVEKSHAGNSYIHVRLGEKDFFESIQAIFATEQIPNATFVQVALFLGVEQDNPEVNPYRELSRLHYQLLFRPNPPKTMVVCIKHIVGHIAVLSNPSGVFGVDFETVSVAIIHHLVSPTLRVRRFTMPLSSCIS